MKRVGEDTVTESGVGELNEPSTSARDAHTSSDQFGPSRRCGGDLFAADLIVYMSCLGSSAGRVRIAVGSNPTQDS